MKRILICGATGSIGTNALALIKKYEVVGISYFNNELLANELVNKYKIDVSYSPNFKNKFNLNSFEDLIKFTKPDVILNAIVGTGGLEVSLLAINFNLDLLLANKETLVIAGNLINKLLKKSKTTIYPIDSEHSALFQLVKFNKNKIKKLLITCSGGSCYFKTKKELEELNFSEALKHPTWVMGYKITIDSATLINKCFEIVEAHFLFGIDSIEAIYHPQSEIHAIVQYIDNSYYFQASVPSMKLAINSALNYFKIEHLAIKELDFNNKKWTFDTLDEERFIVLKWAKEIINDSANSLGLIINVINELAIEKFKNGEINFLMIISLIEKYKNKYVGYKINNYFDIKKLISILKDDFKNE